MPDSKLTILIVDDEAAMREVLKMRLEEWGFDTHLAASGEEARRILTRVDPHAVISDVVLPDVSGLDLLSSLHDGNRDRPVVLITAYGTIDTAVEAMKQGAFDFLTKPIDYGKLKATLKAARQEIELRGAARRLEERLESGAGLGDLIGTSKPMRELFELLQVLADSDASAIITGTSGTGKELAARTIHQLSGRCQEPFVAINTAAIPEGLTEDELFGHERGAFTGASGSRPGYFELAHGGTLFLDEISEMPATLQPKLLRVLEDGRVRKLGSRQEIQVDVRVLAATNRDPEALVESGALRRDLYYRLSVFTVPVPLLRERVEDIPLLAQHFIRSFNKKHGAAVVGVGSEAMDSLRGYSWPGNVRELRNVIERALILARRGWIETIHLPPFIRDPESEAKEGIVLPRGATAAEAEKHLILETLKRVGNNKTRTARVLGLDVKTIRNKLHSYGIQPGPK
ncbi:MAG: sigma-54 dependent transcriptional regulator [Thermoanaerobaculia bacterium]